MTGADPRFGSAQDATSLSRGTALGDPRPIGIFDSGVGGVSVLREVRRCLPAEDIVYVADSAHAPYGDKPAEFIRQRSLIISDFLIARGAKALVVACNTATGIAVDELRRRHALPIVAIEPAIKPAMSLTQTGVVGVLATSQTLASERFGTLVQRLRAEMPGVEAVTQACPGLVEQIEKGQTAGETRALVAHYLEPLLAAGADTIVLGCTHYPLIAGTIQSVAGPGVRLVDPAEAVARELRRRLDERGLLAPADRAGTLRYCTSGLASQLFEQLSRLGVEVSEAQAVHCDLSGGSFSHLGIRTHE
jgi:glutamate racemase